MVKTLYLIRHGEALHNVMFKKMGEAAFRSPLVIDAPLTQMGQEQSIRLGYQWKEKLNIELVLVSPLMRTLETAMNIFGELRTPIVCQEFLREYPLGRDTCNRRSDRDFLQKKFPKIDFNNLQSLTTVDKTISIEPINEKLKAFGWHTKIINGHDHNSIYHSLILAKNNNEPTAVILNTIKGKGVDFMENKVSWHYKNPNDIELEKALNSIN